MSAVIFTTHTSEPGSNALSPRDSQALLPSGDLLTVHAVRPSGSVLLGLQGDVQSCRMAFTAEQARAVAAELLACADALQGGAA
ncbi:hypothetical protein [Comamonas granuli]|uniref:hypothetical protein n=1 Tax=Comamonas granuli TaxID=290309 RepID=UPI0005AB337A|nr:hypothetical protein [Comamonas granuli]